MSYYYSRQNNAKVLEEDAQEYAMDMLGIKITPQGKNGELTKEQVEFILEFTDWYFSGGDWVLEEEQDGTYGNTREDEIADLIYEDNLDRRLLEED